MKMMKKHEGGMSLKYVSEEFGRSLSMVTTILKDKEHIKTAAFGTMVHKMTIITKKRQGPYPRWRYCLGQIQKRARSLYENI